MPFCKTSNIPLLFTKKNKTILDYIIFFIKFILLFDTSCLFPNTQTHKGGALSQMSTDNFAMQPDEMIFSDYQYDPRLRGATMEPEKSEEDEILNRSDYSIVKDQVLGGLNAGKNYVIAFLLLIVNFFFNASLYPSVPFFGVLAFCYATLKWFLMKFKKF
jgi:hypothetical protein